MFAIQGVIRDQKSELVRTSQEIVTHIHMVNPSFGTCESGCAAEDGGTGNRLLFSCSLSGFLSRQVNPRGFRRRENDPASGGWGCRGRLSFRNEECESIALENGAGGAGCRAGRSTAQHP